MKFRAIGLIAAALTGLSALPAQSATVTFESEAAFRCDGGPSHSAEGLTYNYAFAACYYSPSSPADFPTAITSTVMASGYSDTSFTLTGGGVFSLNSVDLAFGPFHHGGLTTDTTLVTGNLFGGGTVSQLLTVGYGFQTHTLNWSGLTSVTFGQFAGASEYLAFDNIVYNAGGAVPEPATWAMMIGGLGIVGAAMRRGNRKLRFA